MQCCMLVSLIYIFLMILFPLLFVGVFVFKKWFVSLVACLIRIACFLHLSSYTFFRHQNVCSGSPCFHNATCLNGFTDKSYKCLCPIGYTGGNCEIGKLKHIRAVYRFVLCGTHTLITLTLPILSWMRNRSIQLVGFLNPASNWYCLI